MVAELLDRDRTIEYARETLRGEPPAAVAWVGYLSRQHLVQFAVELSEAVRNWAVAGDDESFAVIRDLLESWEATAELDAAPEVARHILRPRREKEYVDWSPAG